MSLSKPAAKQPRLQNQTQVTRTESVCLQDVVSHMEEKDHPTTTSPVTMTTSKAPTHPKGHKVRNLDDDVWKTMDSQSFLHLTDTLTLMDVYVQPKSVEPISQMYANVSFIEIVCAPHIKYRVANSKMSVDELLKILYLNDCLQSDMQAIMRISFDEWLGEKTAMFIKAHGVSDSNNRAKLCQYILTEDREFSFYPKCMKGGYGMFFRKICYHSYKMKDKERKKFDNPSMMKCQASRGKFEYMIEARLLPLPDDWFTTDFSEEAEVPATQPLN